MGLEFDHDLYPLNFIDKNGKGNSKGKEDSRNFPPHATRGRVRRTTSGSTEEDSSCLEEGGGGDALTGPRGPVERHPVPEVLSGTGGVLRRGLPTLRTVRPHGKRTSEHEST